MRYTTLLLAVTMLACFGSRSGDRALQDPEVLTQDDIRASSARNAYELVERLRPRWLRPGPDRSLRLDTVILVYFDGVRLGGVDTLRDIERESILTMRVLDASRAGHLPGLGSQHVERVILVSSRTAP
ncbi:hypothetical protein BH23GEM3_BH23GEM3_00370 [soil metagenome]